MEGVGSVSKARCLWHSLGPVLCAVRLQELHQRVDFVDFMLHRVYLERFIMLLYKPVPPLLLPITV